MTSQITGDNLEMHTILGLIEKNDEPKVIPVGKICLKRIASLSAKTHNRNHYMVFEKNNPTLNSLKYFHVCNNYSFDVIHNLLDGVDRYKIQMLFGYLTQHFMSEQHLLSRTYGFDYVFLELQKSSAGNGTGLNSIQTLCLVKNIPLLLGDIIPAGNKNWNLLLLFTQFFFTLSRSRYGNIFQAFDC